MKSIAKALQEFSKIKRPDNLYVEFQQYGVHIADTLGDTKHYSLYIKLCKESPRIMIEEAFNFAKSYDNAKSKGKLFMWKLKQLKKEKPELFSKKESKYIN